MYFHAGLSTKNNPSWWLYGDNREQVGWAGRIFDSVNDAKAAAEYFRANVTAAVFDVYLDERNEWRWRAFVGGDRVASSGEAFASGSNARRAAENVQVNAGSATAP